MGKRIVAREDVFKLVFGYMFTLQKDDEDLELFLMDTDFDESDKEYIKNTYEGVMKNYDEIQKILVETITGYTPERVFKTDKAVLTLGVYELKYTALEKGIVVNECVKLAKKYGTQKSGKFVNGVLAKIEK
ncbi:MAG: transcription antitermination factor NusB [Clostridia bacterium]|nr:transcription antitermination factor NusB [Clostridia bacterium]